MIKLVAEDEKFVLSFKNHPVIIHSTESPAFHVGKGRGRYKFYYGLFKIKDKLNQKRPCRNFRVTENSPECCMIEFDNGLSVRFSKTDGRLEMNFSTKKDFNRMWIKLAADSDEHIYGCGEQYSELDLRGKKVPIWVQEPGLGRGRDLITFLSEIKQNYGGKWYTTYFSQPTFVSSANWFFHSDSSAYSEFDFRKKDSHTLHFWNIPERLVYDINESATGVLKSLTDYLGRQKMMPDWVYDGMMLGIQGGREITERKLNDAKDAGVKVNAIWCQDWSGVNETSFGKQVRWNWKASADLYGKLSSYIKDLNGRGVRFLGYINPFLALDGDLYAEAKEKGYCIKKSDGEDYYVTITTFPAAMVDLTNPAAVSWIKDVIKRNLIGTGLSGWMADYGEYIPTDAVFFSGESGELYHNRYAADWAKVHMEAVEEADGEKEIFFFMRAGYTGSSRYSCNNWNGDQLVNWSYNQGFATVIPGSISLGFTGIGMVHSDLGGFTTIAWIKRSKELFMRWAEMAAFTQIMRTHEGNRPDSNWQFNSDKETLAHLAGMTSVYTALKEYHSALAAEYNKTGLPPVRHPYIHYEDDKVVHTLKYQYLYGRDLMVAPVVKKGRKRWDVYLPEDKWIHLWSGSKHTGGWVRIDAPLGKPPVFYREESKWESLFKEIKNIMVKNNLS